MVPHPVELLAPAGSLDNGIAAINHGADAVYIAGPRFGARAAAGCSIGDIEKLISHAHQFRAKVYITLNTLLTDEELPLAIELAHQLHDLSADGLIIQDFGLIEAGLPPIPLHSSTQMNNREVKKVRFLEQVGFQQVVLARELNLEQIKSIRKNTSVPLEFFVHGALCVSYSGQCYISEVMAGRSANRGECAQFCRHRFTLQDEDGKELEKDRYLLSLKDLDLSRSLRALIDAGISSFKIEGRLKDINYVKNITAYYRKALDLVIDTSGGKFRRGSSGITNFDFTPDPERSFHRGATDYYLKSMKNRTAEVRTCKSTGKPLGQVMRSGKRWFILETDHEINNGDGLCYFDKDGRLVGIRVNRVEGEKIYTRDDSFLSKGQLLYRNGDKEFSRILQKSEQCRVIRLHMRAREYDQGVVLLIKDEDGVISETTIAAQKENARIKGAGAVLAKKQLRKCGGTLFSVDTVRADLDENSYYPAALFNALRRDGLKNHMKQRLLTCHVERIHITPNSVRWPAESVSYLDNIYNLAAKNFYRRHGVTPTDGRGLRVEDEKDPELMRTKYCLRFQLGICPNKRNETIKNAAPLTLADKVGTYQVSFDCKRCEMVLKMMKK